MHLFNNKVEQLKQRLFVKRGIQLGIFTSDIELSGLLLLTAGGIFLGMQSMPALSGVPDAVWPKNSISDSVENATKLKKTENNGIKSMIFETQLGLVSDAPAHIALRNLTTEKATLRLEHASNLALPASKVERMAMNMLPAKTPSLDSLNADLLNTDNLIDGSQEIPENLVDLATIEKTVLPENTSFEVLTEHLSEKALEKKSEQSTIKVFNQKSKLANNKKLSQKSVSPAQEADNFYRQALTYLHAGRVAEAEASLSEALVSNPVNQEVRLTLAALLLDNQHLDEAANLLAEGLKIAPKQLNFSIALARLQVESTGVAVGLQTLEKALPYGDNNAEFHGFLAVLLQRVQRHNEAIAHYKVALVTAPSNMQWLIGLGISLQATQQFSDAREVFTQVQTNASLTAELADFVALRLKELNHHQG